MARLETDDFFKARVDDLLYYRYRDMMVVRTISGFTSEALINSPQYELSRQNASEFGRVSSLCKQVRVALSGILPKQNNLAVVNSLIKKMRAALEHDTTNKRGERQLANALSTESGRQQIQGYEFNPGTTITLDYMIRDTSVTVTPTAMEFPKGIKHIGLRIHQLAFDFAIGENALVSGEWVIGNEAVALDLPMLTDGIGVVFTILETQYYEDRNGDFVPIVEDGGKSVLVVGVE